MLKLQSNCLLTLLILGIPLFLAPCVPLLELTGPAAETPITLDVASVITVTPASPATSVSPVRPATAIIPPATFPIIPVAEEPELSNFGHTGPPPLNGCIVTHPGPGMGPVYIYSGPGEQFPVVAQLSLNRWVQVLKTQEGWHKILAGPNETGWLKLSAVAGSERCSFSESGSNLPVIIDPGLPPANACVATIPGPGAPMVDVYLGPGEQFAIIARLGNWAEILKSSSGWHMILIAPGEIGWVKETAVVLGGLCAMP